MVSESQKRIVRALARVFVLTSRAIVVDPNQNHADLACSAPKRYATQGMMRMHSLRKSTPEIDYLIGQALDGIDMEEYGAFPDNVGMELQGIWWLEYYAASGHPDDRKTVRTLRKEKGISQRELAELVGVSASAVGEWEAGRATPPRQRGEAVARALGVSPEGMLWLRQDAGAEAE